MNEIKIITMDAYSLAGNSLNSNLTYSLKAEIQIKNKADKCFI